MTEVGKLSAVMNVERQEFKNAYTTKMVSTAPRIRDSITLLRLRCASTPPSRVMSICVPGWSLANPVLTSLITPRRAAATLTVLASRDRLT